MLVVQILLVIFARSTSLSDIILSALFMAGIWRIFEKSGIKGWWALIPGAREYQLACCAGRESEGPVYSLASAGSIALQVLSRLLTFNSTDVSTVEIMIVIASLVLGLISFIYSIRVYAGLIDVYGVRKLWLWLWALPYTSFIPALLWGFGKKYQPAWKVEDIRTEMARLATHGSASVMSDGLTVNLTERTATEFFKKKVLLRDIHMAIPQGHMVLLLGGSGAGKTTYLNAINGYEKAKAEVLLNGTDLYKHYKKMQYEVGFVPQSEMMRGKDTVLNT